MCIEICGDLRGLRYRNISLFRLFAYLLTLVHVQEWLRRIHCNHHIVFRLRNSKYPPLHFRFLEQTTRLPLHLRFHRHLHRTTPSPFIPSSPSIMSSWINNKFSWMNASVSAPCLALSAGFSSDESGSDNEIAFNDNEIDNDRVIIKQFLSSSSSNSASINTSNSVSSLNPIPTVLPLSPYRKYLLIPTCTIVFMAVLPFLQGCMYTFGYRMGKRVLGVILTRFKIK